MKNFLEYIDNRMGNDVAVFTSVIVLSAMLALFVLIGVPFLFAHIFAIHPLITVFILLTATPLGVLIYKYNKQK